MAPGGLLRGALASDLREVLRVAAGRAPQPTAAVLDSRTLRSTPESGGRAGYDGHKRKKGSKVHLAVDTLGHLLALRVTPANENDRAAVSALAEAVQEATGDNVDLAWVDQGYEGERPAEAAAAHGIRLEVVKLPEAKPRLRSAAQALGGRAFLRLGHPMPKAGPRLRAPAHHPRGLPRRRLRLPHAPQRRAARHGP